MDIEEACNPCVVLCEEMDDCWQTKEIWGVLMTESFNVGGRVIICEDKSLLFDLIFLRLNRRLSRGELCEDLDDFWLTEDSWGGLMTELFNGGGTCITGGDNSFLFELLSFQLNHRLSRVFVRCLPWFFPVLLLWRLPIPFGYSMINAIWVCGGVVWLLFYLLMAIKSWEPNFLARQMHLCLSFSARNKIYYELFVSI